ncbi:hypothetical protein KJ996_06155, partial [Patescibacteria group bacterium]|nr:hypothetical protein [Patescibacteria group bacterium]
GASSLQGAITAGSTIDAVGNITTDANLTINEDNGDVDAVLTFGNDAGAKALTYSNANTQFEFNDDVKVTGTLGATSNLSASGTLSVEGASSLQGAVTLGSTIAINGVTYTFPASAAGSSGKVLKSDATGILSWATDVNTNAQTECGADQYLDGEGNCVDVIEEAEMDSIGELETQIGSVNVIVSTEIDSESELESLLVDVTNVYTNNDGDLYTTGVADARYVNVSGDTMTGNLIIGNGKTLSVSGTIITETNLTINQDNGAADAVLTFGNDAGAETITFSDSTNQFELSDDVQVGGNLEVNGDGTVSGAIEINDDNSGNATLTFGNDAGDETIVFNDSTNEFDVSDDINVTGTIDASTNISGSGVLSIEGASSLQGAITAGSTIDAVGNITTDANLTINEDNGGANAVLTFGNDGGAETIQFNDSTNEFDVSDDVNVTGTLDVSSNLSASGVISAEGNITTDGNLSGSTLTVDGDVTLRGITYTPPSADGSNGQALTTDGAGNLSWAASGGGTGSGGVLFLSPEYPHAVYTSSGSAYIGQMSLNYDSTNSENFYRWTSTKGTLQEYWVIARIRVPDNFSVWDANEPIEFRYRTGTANAADNYLTMRLYDTAGTQIALTGGSDLKNTSWTTATITGPQASGTYTTSSYITIAVKLTSTSAGSADAGYINLNWETTAP